MAGKDNAVVKGAPAVIHGLRGFFLAFIDESRGHDEEKQRSAVKPSRPRQTFPALVEIVLGHEAILDVLPPASQAFLVLRVVAGPRFAARLIVQSNDRLGFGELKAIFEFTPPTEDLLR